MRRILIAAVLAALVLPPGTAQTQPGPGQIGMYFDAQGTQSSRTIVPFDGFHTYVVVAVPDELSGFEVSLEVPAEITVTGATAIGAPPLCIGEGCGPIDWQMGALDCRSGPMPLLLVDVQAMVLDSQVGVDLPLCVRPLSWSSSDAPGYRTCTDDLKPLSLALSPFGNSYRGCALANPTVLATPTANWGSLKGRFSN